MTSSKEIEISIVSPVYRAEKIVDKLVNEIVKHVSNITDNYEIILIEDGSPDNSWLAITENCKKNDKVKGVKLSRNFGQHHAITAGIQKSSGNWVVVMDCDLQDDPKEIPNFYKKAKEGFDIVVGRRVNRQDNLSKKLSSRLFYKVYDYFTGQKTDPTVGNFGIYSKAIIDSWKTLGEQYRSFGLFINWLGYDRTSIDIQHQGRFEGVSSYSFFKRISLASDSILSYSTKPLRLFITLGFSISLMAFLFGFYTIIKYFVYDTIIEGWTSIMVALFFLSGLIISCLGVVGLYIGKIYEQVKDRPLFVIQKSVNF